MPKLMFFIIVSMQGALMILNPNISASTPDQIHHHEETEGPLRRPFKNMDKLKSFSENFKLCGSFFHKEEFVKYFQECVTSYSSTGEKTSPLSSSESDEEIVGNTKNHTRKRRLTPTLTQYNFSETRLKRDAYLGEATNQRRHGHWKMFENPHVFKNPCLISCVFEKFGMINSTGHTDLKRIQERTEEVLATSNQTDFIENASNITAMCASERSISEESLRATYTPTKANENVSADDLNRVKCRFVIQLGKCLVHSVYDKCHESLLRNGISNDTTTVSSKDSG